MVQRCLGLLAVCLILTGCVMPALPPMPPTPSETRVDAPPQSPPQRPPANDAITLAYGETTTVSDGGLTLTFADVLEDSRCPSDVLCAWSGWVRIQLMAQPANETATAVEITSFTDDQGNTLAPTGNQEAQPFAEVGNYLIELKQVSPYPAKHAEPTPFDQYQIVVEVHSEESRPSDAPPATVTPASLPTTEATPTLAGSANCPEAPQLPLLCYSNRAITEYAAGARTESPMLLTAPVAICQIPTQQAGDILCAATFGEDWEMADTDTVSDTSVWYELVPSGSAYWVWDEQNDELSAQE